MRNEPRVVIDTNILLSRLLLVDSVPGRAVDKAISTGQLLVSAETMEELARVLSRRKFDRYISVEKRIEFLRDLSRVVEMVPIVHRIHVCRDAKDDKFLEVAVNGSAQVIVTGDVDLLALHPFREIAVLSAANYLRL